MSPWVVHRVDHRREEPGTFVTVNDDELITLDLAAAELGVHYMTAYRRVRSGRLRATQDGRTWWIRRGDLRGHHHPAVSSPLGSTEAFTTALFDGDETAAWDCISRQLHAPGGTSIERASDLLLDVIAASLRQVGDQWARGETSVAAEHRASALALRLIARIGAEARPPGRRSRLVLIGAPLHDIYTLPAAIFGELLRLRGCEVIEIGSDLRPEDLAEATSSSHEPQVLCLSCTQVGNETAIRSAIAAIRRRSPQVLIAAGGLAVPTEAIALALGADLGGSDTVAVANRIAGRSRHDRGTNSSE